jgi:drug/metabolite transporter (DMT)-like permease
VREDEQTARVPTGVAIGVVALGERLAWSSGLGLLLVLIGVAAMTTEGRSSIRRRRRDRGRDRDPAALPAKQ